MTTDQERLLTIAKWKWPEFNWEVSPWTSGVKTTYGSKYFSFEDIEPIWQEHGQKVIEWKEKEFGNLLPCNGFRETWLRDSYCWLKSIATGTEHDKAVALGEWIDATD